MSSENVPESVPKDVPETESQQESPISKVFDKPSEPQQQPDEEPSTDDAKPTVEDVTSPKDDLTVTAEEDTVPDVDLNETIYHDTLDTIEDTDLNLTEVTKEENPVDLNATLPYFDATDFPVAQSSTEAFTTPVEPTKSKSQQVIISETGELIDPDEIPPESSTLVMRTELGPPKEEPKVEPPFKSRRVQVPSTDITRGISQIEPSPKKPPKRKLPNPTPQKIGVLVGVPCRRRSSIKSNNEDLQKEKLKHLAVVFLLSRLKNPIKWNSATFEEIRSVGDAIDNDQVKAKLAIPYKDKSFNMALTGTIVKGRINSKDAPPPIFNDALLEHIPTYSGLVVKCESEYMLTWKVSDGFYLYEPCLNDSSQLLFFNGFKMMVEFIVDQKKLKDRSKYYLSKISWISLDDGHIVTLQRKWRVPKRFELKNQNVALLMGDSYLKEASFKLESLRVSLNAIELAQDVQARSWDASTLNGLFAGTISDKLINKLGIFLCEQGSEAEYLLDRLRMLRLNVSFTFTQRDPLEQLINRLLTTRIALILKVDESYFAIWSSEQIVYWFSPFRYDALEQDPKTVDENGCFLFAFNSLAKLSTKLFDHLTELKLLPKHPVQLFSVDGEPFGPTLRIPVVDSSDSLNRSELEIRVVQDPVVKRYVSDVDLPPTTLSEAKVCRLMVRELVGAAKLENGDGAKGKKADKLDGKTKERKLEKVGEKKAERSDDKKTEKLEESKSAKSIGVQSELLGRQKSERLDVIKSEKVDEKKSGKLNDKKPVKKEESKQKLVVKTEPGLAGKS